MSVGAGLVPARLPLPARPREKTGRDKPCPYIGEEKQTRDKRNESEDCRRNKCRGRARPCPAAVTGSSEGKGGQGQALPPQLAMLVPINKVLSLVLLTGVMIAFTTEDVCRREGTRARPHLNNAFLQHEVQDPASTAGDDVLRISTDLTVLDVQVLTARENSAIASLRASDFELFEDGKRQEITYFSVDRIPLSVILLLDVSGSVLPYIEDIGRAGIQALSRLKPNDEVAIMTFGHIAEGYVHVIQGFSRDRERTAQRLGQILETGHSGGGTNIPFALREAAQYMKTTGYARTRRVIIAITDNQPAALGALKNADMEDLLSNLYESDSLVCALLAGSSVSRLEQLALSTGRNAVLLASRDFKVDPYVEATGGESIRYQEQVTPKLAELLDRLRTRYSIGYASTNQSYDGKFRKISLKLTKDARLTNEKIIVRTRRGYYAKKKGS